MAIVTLFPEMVQKAAAHSILGRAQAGGRLALNTVNPRDFTFDRHRSADDYPFGGGAGMVMKPEPLARAIEAAAEGEAGIPAILLAPDGERFTQALAKEMAAWPRYTLVCGHYEGIDERVRETHLPRTLSIGDYVLTGGELAALVVLDAVTRLLPGVLGNASSTEEESFSAGLLEYPHYTRPAAFRGRTVPEVLLSGHHARIETWRRQQALVRTRERRPDLLEKMLPLDPADQKLLDAWDSAAAVRAEESVRVSEPVSEAPEGELETARGCAEETNKERKA